MPCATKHWGKSHLDYLFNFAVGRVNDVHGAEGLAREVFPTRELDSVPAWKSNEIAERRAKGCLAAEFMVPFQLVRFLALGRLNQQ
jgi:hypothetical protein